MRGGIQLRQLRVLGVSKNYEVQFEPGLNVIAGEISTGKTSILQLVDYCLGNTHHPEHIELQRRARSCLLWLEVAGTDFTIERALFSSRGTATIHECSLDELPLRHESHEVSATQTMDRESISSFLLKRLDLWNVELKEAPTKEESGTDRMSIRDLMRFCFLQSKRLDNENLLFESEFVNAIKFRQVFDVLFGLHGNRSAQLSREITALNSHKSTLESETRMLVGFLKENHVPDLETLQKTVVDCSKWCEDLERNLEGLASLQRTETDFLQGLRLEHSSILRELRDLNAGKREHETLLRRLLPLRGQYSEEIKKLRLLQESKRVLDPLGVVNCPVCSQTLPGPSDASDGRCFLCHQPMPEGNEELRVDKEIRSLETRLRELNDFIEDTEVDIKSMSANLADTNARLAAVQRRMEEATRNFVSPSQARRDSIIVELTSSRKELQAARRQLGFWDSLEARYHQLGEVKSLLVQKQVELQELQTTLPDRKSIIEEFSARFSSSLAHFRFPKLSNALVDAQLVPHVRGLVYRKIGSNGAMTLAALGWYIAMFSLSLDRNGQHPGFMMIDSPQKNIGVHGSKGEQIDLEYRDEEIVRGVYDLLLKICAEHAPKAQIIVVDNSPPPIAESSVIVRFTGRPGQAPYGFIDDEEG